MRVILVTGGAGFIGSTFIKYFLRRNKNYLIANFDKLTYAGNLNNLKELEDSPRYHFIKGDICNAELVDYVLRKYRPGCIINFASESDVQRSITHPASVVTANVIGTLTLLDGARYIWGKRGMSGNRFIQVSTDEVYGFAQNDKEYFLEESPLSPDNPYAAAKASADLLVGSFAKTYGIPTVVVRSCANYGPAQHIEKFVPACITNALQDKPLVVGTSGMDSREWVHVLDHSIALIRALFYGKPGEIYNIGSGEKVSNLELARKILKVMGKPESLIQTLPGRTAGEKSIPMNSYKARNNLNWSSKYKLEEGLKETIQWYQDNTEFWTK